MQLTIDSIATQRDIKCIECEEYTTHNIKIGFRSRYSPGRNIYAFMCCEKCGTVNDEYLLGASYKVSRDRMFD